METRLKGCTSIDYIRPRTTFDWAFIQTSNVKLEEADCREKLIGILGRSELTLAMVKRVLTLVCHRVEASRPTSYVGIEGLLLLLGDSMTLAKQNLLPQDFDAAKEFMISRLNHFKVLCTTPVPSGTHDGESLVFAWCNIVTNDFFQFSEALSHPSSAVTSTISPCSVTSSSIG